MDGLTFDLKILQLQLAYLIVISALNKGTKYHEQLATLISFILD